MIVIPNMEKPKTCHECRLHSYDWGNEYIMSHDVCHPLRRCFNSPQYDGGSRVDTLNEIRPDCPLIEIVRCKECKWLGVDDGMPFCNWWLREIEPNVFCSYGERRADDSNKSTRRTYGGLQEM